MYVRGMLLLLLLQLAMLRALRTCAPLYTTSYFLGYDNTLVADVCDIELLIVQCALRFYSTVS